MRRNHQIYQTNSLTWQTSKHCQPKSSPDRIIQSQTSLQTNYGSGRHPYELQKKLKQKTFYKSILVIKIVYFSKLFLIT